MYELIDTIDSEKSKKVNVPEIVKKGISGEDAEKMKEHCEKFISTYEKINKMVISDKIDLPKIENYSTISEKYEIYSKDTKRLAIWKKLSVKLISLQTQCNKLIEKYNLDDSHECSIKCISLQQYSKILGDFLN